MNCKTRPILVGEPYGVWSGRYFSEQWFDKTSFDIRGNIIFTKNYPIHPKKESRSAKVIFNKKLELIKAGYANQDDANYFALKVLQKYPNIANALVGRFPEVIIDEAQDTTEIQMAIIDELVKAGLKEIILVGDQDQAIFEWNTANPQLFQEKTENWECIILNECHRSSQKICDFAYKLSSLKSKAIAISKDVSEYLSDPHIVKLVSLKETVDSFITFCEKLSIKINKENVAILCRSKRLVSDIAKTFGEREAVQKSLIDNYYDIWDPNFFLGRDICHGKYLIDNGEYKKGYKLIEMGLFKFLNQNLNFSQDALRNFVQKYNFIKWRKQVHETVNLIPITSLQLGAWISQFPKKIVGIPLIHNLNKVLKNREYAELEISSIFDRTNSIIEKLPFRLGTIHSVKGETFEAVLLVINNKAQNTKYSTILSKTIPGKLKDEELRTLYVAITRPRKILMLAVPIEDYNMWRSFFN